MPGASYTFGAILYLADKDRRSQLAMNLLMRLPEYVAAGRHLDGWLIQVCAHATLEDPEESNPFLFEMFSHGHDAWTHEERARESAILREVGLDPERMQSMTMEEMDAWLQAQEADPAAKARMEAVMEAHPEQRAQAAAGWVMGAITSLEQEDASCHNYFLTALCYRSLRAMPAEALKPESDDADLGPPPQPAT